MGYVSSIVEIVISLLHKNAGTTIIGRPRLFFYTFLDSPASSAPCKNMLI